MRSILNKPVPITRDSHLGLPQARWRNHLAQWFMVGLFAVFSVGHVAAEKVTVGISATHQFGEVAVGSSATYQFTLVPRAIN